MKRSNTRKWLACLLALCTVLALCACGGKTPEPPKTPKEVMQEAYEKLAGAKSISFDMDMQMTIGVQGQAMDMNITMSADTIAKPMHAHGNLSMDMLGTKMDTEVYLVQNDDGVVTYTGIREDGNVTAWYKTTVSAEDVEALQAQVSTYDVDGTFSTQLEAVDKLKEVGAETVNGKNATRYDGVIHGSDIAKVLGQTEAASTLEMIGIDPSKLDQDVPTSIWIYEDGLPARYDIDMTSMFTQLMAQSEEAAGVEVSAMKLSMTITGVDTVSEIVIPQEALDAQEVSAGSIIPGTPEPQTPEEGEAPSDEQDGTFTTNGMTIKLTEDFQKETIAGFTACFISDDVVIVSLREPFTLMEGMEDLTVEEYGQLVIENNGVSSELEDFGGIPGFEYDYTDGDSGETLHYRAFLYKAGDAFWMVQFSTYKDNFARFESQINQWAQTVTFAG